MSRTSGVLAAMKAVPGGARHTPAPQSGGMGSINQVAANAQWGNPYQNTYGPFLPRPSRVFTDGAFGPMSPIQPVPVDEPPPGGWVIRGSGAGGRTGRGFRQKATTRTSGGPP